MGSHFIPVSTPAYDNNDFIMGLSSEQWTVLNEDENKPMYNRFRQVCVRGLHSSQALRFDKMCLSRTVSLLRHHHKSNRMGIHFIGFCLSKAKTFYETDWYAKG